MDTHKTNMRRQYKQQSASQDAGSSDISRRTSKKSQLTVSERISSTASSDDTDFPVPKRLINSKIDTKKSPMDTYKLTFIPTQNKNTNLERRGKHPVSKLQRTKPRQASSLPATPEPHKMQRNIATIDQKKIQTDLTDVGLRSSRAKSMVKSVNFQVAENRHTLPEFASTPENTHITDQHFRKNISPFIRQSSPFLRKFEKLITTNNEDPHKISLHSYKELVDRIDKLELIVDKHYSDITLDLGELNRRMNILSGTDIQTQDSIQESSVQYNDEENSHTRLLKSRLEQMEEKRRTFTILYFATTAVGLILITLVYYWLREYLGGFSLTTSEALQNWHILFMVTGIIFLNSQGMLAFRVATALTRKKPKSLLFHVRIIHNCVHIVAFILGSLAVKAAFDSHNYSVPPVANMYTLHAWVGLSTFILYSIQVVSGLMTLIPNISPKLIASLWPVNAAVSLTCFLMAVGSCLLGLMEKLIWTLGAKYAEGSVSGYLANSAGLLLVVFGGLVVYLLRGMK